MPCVLIIDDDKAVRSAAKILLTANGLEVVEASDGQSGLDASKHRHFDLIIVDLFMPGMNGLDTIKAIRSNNSDVAIIAVSGFMLAGSCPEMPGFEAMAIEAGATSTLYKPFRPKEFMRALQKSIGLAAPANRP